MQSFRTLDRVYFFFNSAAFTTPLGSLTSRTTSQTISPNATTDRPRKKSLSISMGAGVKYSA